MVRVSGKDALVLCNQCLKSPLDSTAPRLARFGELCHPVENRIIDQVVAIYFKSPSSYTGEDMVEISCHCNPLIIDDILSSLVGLGARIAMPGEFTLRAFLNGKIDLAQAEAVADVIGARTRESVNQSMRHLGGKLSEDIERIRSEILNLLSMLEINLDFSEEDIQALSPQELKAELCGTVEHLQKLIDSYDYGRLLKQGVKMLILGKPNVGKSSLLNSLLQRERAIVSEIPGTTRDYIEEEMTIGGFAVQAVDTAGIRVTSDEVELQGISRALEHLQSSDLVLCLFDAHSLLDSDDAAMIDIIQERRKDQNWLLVLNKTDLGIEPKALERISELQLHCEKISAKTGTGIGALQGTIRNMLISDRSLENEEIVITSVRQRNVLMRTVASLKSAINSIEQSAGDEIIALDLRLALDTLGEITGEVTSEDILNHIFGNFCIGK